MRLSHISQVLNCDNSFCDYGINARKSGMDLESIQMRLDALDLKQRDIADAIGIGQDKVSKVFNGVRQWRGQELIKLLAWLDDVETRGDVARPNLPPTDAAQDYLPVEILPSFAGMGGGGNGDGDPAMGLISRRVIEDELRARPSDLLLIDVRGDSMLPDFHHGDQILIDKRDTNLAQPGSFCIWDGDGYVIKLVERIPHNRDMLRVFSANSRYSPYEVMTEDVRILGRPVWFARRI